MTKNESSVWIGRWTRKDDVLLSDLLMGALDALAADVSDYPLVLTEWQTWKGDWPFEHGSDGRNPSLILTTCERFRMLVNKGDVAFSWLVASVPNVRDGAATFSLDMLPYADGNAQLFVDPPAMQCSGNVMEIVIWDDGELIVTASSLEHFERVREHVEAAGGVRQ